MSLRLCIISLAIGLAVSLGDTVGFAQSEADQVQTPAPTPAEAGASSEAAPEAAPDKPKLEVHGFLQENVSLRATSPVELLKAESRLQLEVSRKTPRLEFLAKTDFVYDPAAIQGRDARADVREAYLTSYGRNLDLRVGK